MTDTEAPAKLIVQGGRIVLDDKGQQERISATQIFRIAVRGADEMDGRAVSPRADLSAPGIIFRQEPAEVVLHIQSDGDRAIGGPAIRHRGAWVNLDLDEDHVLIGHDWYPLESDTLRSVEAWLHGHEVDGLSAADYLGLYRGLDRPFRIIDDLSDHDVVHLAGGSNAVLGLQAQLYAYQSDGLRWPSARANSGLGGILADEMGLGKTLQIIALIAQRRSNGDASGPALVIVPATLLENWSRELAKFAPSLRLYRHSGSGRTRRPAELAKPDVVLTTYETAVIDSAVLEQVAWDLLVADEAQAIKNPDAQRSQAPRGFSRVAAFAVTGTPLENRTLDTWSLADFAVPGYLGTRGDFASTLEAEPELLSRALKPLVLRREVKDVAADLPEKIEADVALEMFAEEARLYDAVRDAVRGDRTRAPILALLTKLRMFTAHPDCVYGTAPHPEARSAKLTRLLEILDELQHAGAKSLIFVAFNQAADIVVASIQRRSGVPVWPVDGRTPVQERQRIIDQFSTTAGPAALVLNPAAAGTGLNIQAASHVVHYTLEWNPARESQATARAWRRGQTLPVTVHRLFYGSSIDEVLLERLRLKRELFDTVIQASDVEIERSLKELLDRALGFDRTPSTAVEYPSEQEGLPG